MPSVDSVELLSACRMHIDRLAPIRHFDRQCKSTNFASLLEVERASVRVGIEPIPTTGWLRPTEDFKRRWVSTMLLYIDCRQLAVPASC